jgi:hypothetical protein
MWRAVGACIVTSGWQFSRFLDVFAKTIWPQKVVPITGFIAPEWFLSIQERLTLTNR